MAFPVEKPSCYFRPRKSNRGLLVRCPTGDFGPPPQAARPPNQCVSLKSGSAQYSRQHQTISTTNPDAAPNTAASTRRYQPQTPTQRPIQPPAPDDINHKPRRSDQYSRQHQTISTTNPDAATKKDVRPRSEINLYSKSSTGDP